MPRGGGRGGRGGGRGGRGGSSMLPAMGLSFADIQNLSREATALYPPMNVPIPSDITDEEKRIAEVQIGFAARLRRSPYYIIEKSKSTELPRYSDKYRSSTMDQPTLKRKDLHAPFFPPEVFEGYFNPKRTKIQKGSSTAKPRMNLDEMGDEEEDQA
ncbi:hypothetical protein L208DRAFT_786584 [Tricholoma matsutake]|nr:hypothetical protein L208DRAFT_786584 [Tricholoma matsutake 945]